MAIDKDLLRKKVWKGEKGRQSYSSLMQKARPLFQPPSGESGRASMTCVIRVVEASIGV